jgi:hypothetical protein
MDGLVVGIHACLLERLTQSGMGVAGSGQIFGTSSVFNGNDRLGNHFTRIRSNNVRSQNLVRLGTGQDLDETVGGTVGSCSTIGRERKVTLVVLDTRLLQFFFRLSDRRHFGVRVNDTCEITNERKT